MKLSNKQQIDTHFSLSSMTDIVFLLLIFFMLTIASVNTQALPIELPISNNADVVSPQVNITITADLTYYVDNQKITRAQVATLLQQKLRTEQSAVLLQMDKSVPVEHMIYVTDLAASLHAKIAVATKPE